MNSNEINPNQLPKRVRKLLDERKYSRIPKRYFDNKDFVLEAVKEDGGALKYAPEELRNDKEVVSAVVKILDQKIKKIPVGKETSKEVTNTPKEVNKSTTTTKSSKKERKL